MAKFDGTFKPEVEERMHIKPLAPMPKNFQARLTEDQLNEFTERDRPLLLAMSKLEQQNEFMWAEMQLAVHGFRQFEHSFIETTDTAKRWVKWGFCTIVGAVAAAAAMWMFHVI